MAPTMEAIRGLLSAELLARIERELGREATLRLMWPYLVGPQLAANTELKAVRGTTLLVAAPDRAWLGTIRSFEHMILEAVNRLGSGRYDSMDVIEQPRISPAKEIQHPTAPSISTAPRMSFDASAIPDRDLRQRFSESAEKYLADQSERTKR